MTFEHTLWLYSIPVAAILLIGGFIAWQQSTRKRLNLFAAQSLLPSLLKSHSKIRAYLKYTFTSLGILTLLAALAQPQSGYTWEERSSSGIDVIFAVDASRSMLAEDIKPNRLERSKFAVLDLLKKLGGHRVGLVAFAGGAFLQCPLTFDYDAFRQSLEAIDTRVILKGGSDLGGAIRECAQSFQSGKNKKILIVLTDGEDLGDSSMEAAQEAANQGIVIYTVGVGTPEGELIPLRTPHGGVDYVRDDKNRLVKSKLDEATLSSVAELTGGFYSRLGNTNWGLETLYEGGLEVIKGESSERQKIPLERFQWPLTLALILLGLEAIIGTRKRSFIKARSGAPLVIFSMGTLLIGNPSSLEANDTHLYNEGTQLYNEGHYQEAEEKLSLALETGNINLQERTFYNLGNARYREGQVQRGTAPHETKRLWEAALKDYSNALELNPKNENATYNQQVVQKALEQLNKELEEQQKENNQEPSENNEDSQEENSKEDNPEQQNQESTGDDSQPPSKDSNEEEQQSEDHSSESTQETKNSEPQDSQDQNNEENRPESPKQDEAEGPSGGKQNQEPSQEEKEPRDGKHEDPQEKLSLDPDKNPIESPQENGSPQESMDTEAQWEAIRKDEAARLLDSLKSEERKLPYMGTQEDLNSEGPTQDW